MALALACGSAGLAKALTAVTLQANHQDWANATFGRRPAKEGDDPAKALANKFQGLLHDFTGAMYAAVAAPDA